MDQLNLQKIAPGNESLKFLEKRSQLVNYRGVHKSQHNRYELKDVVLMLKTMHDLVGMDKMKIRNTDLSKRPINTPDEAVYAEYTDKVCSAMGRGTQDSIRKNHFVDFHRMGFIKRYDNYENELDPYDRSSVRYVSLTKLGYQLCNESNIFNQRMIYSKGLNNLLSNYLEDLLSIILELNTFNIFEYTFFISFLDEKMDDKVYSQSEIVSLVNSYRNLSRYQREAAVNSVKEYMDPNKFNYGDKTDKRDFHNWINESQQIFMLLNQTVYFEQNSLTMKPRVGNEGIFDEQIKLDRSKAEKDKYYIYHNVDKEKGFELHHIVPLMWAQSRDEWVILDNHKNLVYIDGYKHSLITQNSNRNVVLNFANDDAVFTDYDDNSIYCEYMKNIIYNPINKNEMKDYNTQILDGFE